MRLLKIKACDDELKIFIKGLHQCDSSMCVSGSLSKKKTLK